MQLHKVTVIGIVCPKKIFFGHIQSELEKLKEEYPDNTIILCTNNSKVHKKCIRLGFRCTKCKVFDFVHYSFFDKVLIFLNGEDCITQNISALYAYRNTAYKIIRIGVNK